MKKNFFEAALAGIDDAYIVESADAELGALFGKRQRSVKPLKFAFAAAVCTALVISAVGMWMTAAPPATPPALPDNSTSVTPDSTTVDTPDSPNPPVVPEGFKLSALTFTSNGNGTSTLEGLVDAETVEKIVVNDKDLDSIYAYEPIEEYDFPCHTFKTVVINGGTVIESMKLYEGYREIREITVPEGVEELPYRAFYDFKDLQKIDLPSTLKIISDSAFVGCETLSEISLPDGLEKIGSSAFAGCVSLTEIKIPKSVVEIGHQPLPCSENLKKISVPFIGRTREEPDTMYYLLSFGHTTQAPVIELLDEIEVTDALCIADNAFNFNVRRIILNEGIVAIGSEAFCGMNYEPTQKYHLQYDVDLPDSVQVLLTYPGRNITSLHLGPNVKEFSFSVFTPLTKLRQITVSEGNRYFRAVDNVLFTADMKNLVLFPRVSATDKYSVPKTVEAVGDYAFYQSNLQELYLPDGVTYIGEGAFRYSSVTTVNFPASVKYVGYQVLNHSYATAYCAAHSLPEEWDEECFGFAVRVKWSVYYVGPEATELNIEAIRAANPKEITVAEENPEYRSEKGVLFSKDMTELILFPASQKRYEYIVPESVKVIDSGAFYNTLYLMRVIIAEGVEKIESRAFASPQRELVLYSYAAKKPDGWADDWMADDKSLSCFWGYRDDMYI